MVSKFLGVKWTNIGEKEYPKNYVLKFWGQLIHLIAHH
jgi:hypothetical protein